MEESCWYFESAVLEIVNSPQKNIGLSYATIYKDLCSSPQVTTDYVPESSRGSLYVTIKMPRDIFVNQPSGYFRKLTEKGGIHSFRQLVPLLLDLDYSIEGQSSVFIWGPSQIRTLVAALYLANPILL
jgi:hypothetical protein